MKEEIKYKAIEYGEKNNLEEEDVAYFMTLMDEIYELGYNVGWKQKDTTSMEEKLEALDTIIPKKEIFDAIGYDKSHD